MSKKMPVKYALIPIYDYDKVIGSYLVHDIRLVAYAVSKCYIKEEIKKYDGEGEYTLSYKVQYPCDELYIQRNITKSENYSLIVDEVYDDIDSALIARKQKNEGLMMKRKSRKGITYEEQIENKVNYIEENIITITSDMQTNSEYEYKLKGSNN